MTVGVICTCAPSFSRALHEHSPIFELVRSSLHSSFRSTRRLLSRPSETSSWGYEQGGHGRNSNDTRSYGYHGGDETYRMQDVDAVRTFVYGDPGKFVQENGIQLKSEIIQHEHAANHGFRQGVQDPEKAIGA